MANDTMENTFLGPPIPPRDFGDENMENVHQTLKHILKYAFEIFKRSNMATRMGNRVFREFFGCGAIVASVLWEHLSVAGSLPEGGRKVHLLWCLHFMKAYLKGHVLAYTVGCDPKTFRKWVWRFVASIADIQDNVVSN